MISNFRFLSPVNIVFGNGSIENIGQECFVLGTDKILLVTDEFMATTTTFSVVIDSCKKANIEPTIYTGVVPDPDLECIEKGLGVLSAHKCTGLIALGGGSSIDAAKGIALLATNRPPILKYSGVDKLSKPALPIIAIPTTAGTGSEVSSTAIITSHEERRKFAVISPLLYPKKAIIDPIVLNTMPMQVASFTSMDNITHAIESYIAKASSPMTEMYSRTSLMLSAKSVRAFVSKRNDVEAASNMFLASILAGIALGNARLGVAHAIANPLGAVIGKAHGLCCSLILPACLEAMENDSLSKYALIAKIFEPRLEHASDKECAKVLPDIITKLQADLGIEQGLAKFGIHEEDIQKIAKDAMASGVALCSPKEFALDDIVVILRKAL
jgi:alcohol dehydrogenase class IV